MHSTKWWTSSMVEGVRPNLSQEALTEGGSWAPSAAQHDADET